MIVTPKADFSLYEQQCLTFLQTIGMAVIYEKT
jgi:hypothetical protein